MREFTHTLKQNSLYFGLFLIVSMLILSACSKKELIVYTDRYSTLPQAIIDEFTQQTSIPVQYKSFSSLKEQNALYKKIKRKKRAPIDVLITSNFYQLESYTENDKLLPLESGEDTPQEITEHVYPNFKDIPHWKDLSYKHKYWVGITSTSKVFVSHHSTSSIPKTYEELMLYKGKILISDPRSNVGIVPITAFMTAQYGEAYADKWVSAITAKLPRLPYGRDIVQVRDVFEGLADIGIVDINVIGELLHSFDEYDRNMIDRLRVVLPSPMYFYPNRAVGVLASSQFGAEAKQLIQFLLSSKIQTKLSEHFFDYPVTNNSKIHSMLLAWGGMPQDAPSYTVPHLYENYYDKAYSLLEKYNWIAKANEQKNYKVQNEQNWKYCLDSVVYCSIWNTPSEEF